MQKYLNLVFLATRLINLFNSIINLLLFVFKSLFDIKIFYLYINRIRIKNSVYILIIFILKVFFIINYNLVAEIILNEILNIRYKYLYILIECLLKYLLKIFFK